MDIDLKQKFKSHPDKLLFDHLNGVAEKACIRWDSKFAEVISLFHDLGKINPNFQNKLDGKKTGYSNCLLYTSPSPRDRQKSRMPSSA